MPLAPTPIELTFEAYDEVDRGLFCLSTPLNTCSICNILECFSGMRRPKTILGRGKVGDVRQYELLFECGRSTIDKLGDTRS